MSTPRVGVGLPVFNGAKYIAEAIESLLAQTFSDFELVISDNASTDATEEICRDFASRDSRIRYFREPRNRGAAWNFNRTVELARGEYFKWLSHDDVIGPHYLARAVDVLDQDRATVLCHSKTGIIDMRGDLVGDHDSDDLEAWELQGISREMELGRLQRVRSPFPYQRYLGVLLYSVRCYEVFGLIRGSALRKTGLHRPYLSGEKVFLAELSLLGPFDEVPEILSFSRWHPDRFSSNASVRAQNMHVDPNSAHQILLPRQLRSTCGYLMNVIHGEFDWGQRARCLAVVGRFVFQTKKWRAILRDYAHGIGQTAKLPERSIHSTDGTANKRHWTSLSDVYSKGTV
jgi:glycosyltransferase involved in cell wall biosynthesis